MNNMPILSIFKIAFKALNANKLRTSLAVLGVTIGITAVIIVFSAGEGIKSLISSQIESFGRDLIETEIKIPSNKKGLQSEQQNAFNLLTGVQVTTLTLDDMKDINKLPNVNDSYAVIMAQEPITYKDEFKRSIVYAVSSTFIDIDKTEIKNGRFFTEAEDKSLAQVAIIGSGMKEKLFGENNAIGKSIKIRKLRFKIIGITKEQGAIFGIDFDDFVYMPIKTMQKKIMGINYVYAIIHKINDISMANSTTEEIRILLRNNHDISQPEEIQKGVFDTGKDDFRVVTMTEIQDIWGNVSGALTLLLLAIVAISLLVGGVGILNVMYVIVNERTKEIGLRKAVGASYSNIMWQFLAESILITLASGIAGILLGILISYLISFGASSAGLDWQFSIPLKAFVTAITFSVVFGIFFGLYPARQAAKKDPIEALGYE